jgi:hypothetical protein
MSKSSGFIKDDSEWRKMKKNLLKGQQLCSKVGVFDKFYGPENDNLPVATILMWNEEGNQNMPMRPSIRAGFIPELQKNAWIDQQVINWLNMVMEGKMTWTTFYTKLGPQLADMMQKEIEKWSVPMNAPLTIELKGFNNPLIDSGTMVDSVESQLGRRTGD